MCNSHLWLSFFMKIGRVGLEIPKVEVRFENLHVTANVQIGSRALPTLVNYSRDMIEVMHFTHARLFHSWFSSFRTQIFF